MLSRLTSLVLLTLSLSLRAADAPRPNILLILADDLGYSDLGCYGGEISTPNLDALARGGLRFTQFYNTARCWPSRAAILTGYYAQQVRRDTVPGVPSGGAGVRPAWARLLPELLRPLGYRSYHSGKWHLDGKPLETGFDHSYSLNDHDRYFNPRQHTEDDVALPAVTPGSGYYATTAIAEHAIQCLKEHAAKYSGQPFFEYLAFTSPHFPVQAPAVDIARYRDAYLQGWDALRAARWQRMSGLGLGVGAISAVERELGPPYAFPEALAKLGPNEVNRPLAWSGLSPAQRRFQADKMAVHAAMVDRMDREIGRVLDQVRAMGDLENTIVLFLSDNGASAEMMVRGDGHDPDAECGTGATFLSIGPGWSTLANTPFRRHKTWVHEGGISTPFILHWPRGIAAQGELRHAPGHLIDILPTLLELAGGRRMETWQGQPVSPPPGKSLVPLLSQDRTSVHESLWWMHEGNRALRVGDWKIVAAGENAPWELYNLRGDRSESTNLATAMPAKVRELAEVWERQTRDFAALASKDVPPPYPGWAHTGSIAVLTTPEGANLPASAVVNSFPLLVRLNQDFFNFAEAKPNGEDIRFSSALGTPLAYQIEEWDAARGTASIWVRVPRIQGNARQRLQMHWGRPNASSESNGEAVFNESNGYLSVWHMTDSTKDETGPIQARDTGTTATRGVIGAARHFPGGQGIFGGDRIAHFPTEAAPHSSEAWVRSQSANATILGWGNERAQGKVVLQFRSPPHIAVDCYFSDGNVRSGGRLGMSQWVHVAHTYEKGQARLYVNGVLDGTSSGRSKALAIQKPASLWIGGWAHDYDFVGEMDEVRVSRLARSADWVRLEYENQKPLQTLVGPPILPGTKFAVSPTTATLQEGTSATFSAEAGGAEKVYWILKRDDWETVVAVDRLRFQFNAGRVTRDTSLTLQCRAVYPNGVKTQDIPITIQDDIPEPEFKLQAPAHWDGRSTIEIVPQISNLSAMQAKGAGDLTYDWTASGLAVIRERAADRLVLSRAQNSGKLVVTGVIHNGGQPTVQSATIEVTEPRHDPWVARTPTQDEKPVDNQFYARDDQNEGTLFYNGTLEAPTDSVSIKLYADGRLEYNESQQPAADRSYAFVVKLRPGLVRYTVELSSRAGGRETPLRTVTNVVCGDAYVIQGQSNAVATDWGKEEPTFRSEWIRTYGAMSGDTEGLRLWGEATHRSRDSGSLQVGYWGMELARRLVERHQMPICILNGAVGGTRIDQHQRNPQNPADMATIYGRLLWRAQQAGLTHGIRGVFWHQGENDQGADGPSGGYGWETYRQYFIDLAAAWKRDFPNLQRYYVFQIWPKACAMGVDGSDNRLREAQRTLPSDFSRLSIMSTLGIEPPGGCHYPAAGYAELARLICPLVERDNYGRVFNHPITPPNLVQAYFATAQNREIVLEFDQPVRWDDGLTNQFYLGKRKQTFSSGSVSGHVLRLQLASTATEQTITYLDGASWSQAHLLRGESGIAALTFCEAPILNAK